MDLLDIIDDVLEQEKYILPSKGETQVDLDFSFDEVMFDKMANFILNLDPDKLSDNQLNTVMKILDDIKLQAEEESEEIDELRKPRLAKRTPLQKNQASKRWYSKNRTHVKRRERKLRRSAEGRKREARAPRLARQNKTPTERKRVRYHVRKKSKRRKDGEPTK
jgi:hypothetical protein